MGEELSLWTGRKRHELLAAPLCRFVDPEGTISWMRWIPPFTARKAVTTLGAGATPSGTIGDWFHPILTPAGAVETTDFVTYSMGGFWVDQYLCSSRDASAASMGTVADGGATKIAYHSQRGVAPRVNEAIAHFKTYLVARFASGAGFLRGDGPQVSAAYWATHGGLITDQHWFEIYVWTRINRILLRGNTAGYDGTNAKAPQYHGDGSELGQQDTAHPLAYGVNVAGGGPPSWDLPVSDFCGNRWEFTDGLRLYNTEIWSAGKTIDPAGPYNSAAYTDTGLTIAGVTSGQSVTALRGEAAIARHGTPASTGAAGGGPFDGMGFWYAPSGEMVAIRGGFCDAGAQCPGALSLGASPSDAEWDIGARAVLIP
ncbi:MAG: hypothetical protein ABSD47_01050 [Candidatus Methylomirabilota bacterium]